MDRRRFVLSTLLAPLILVGLPGANRRVGANHAPIQALNLSDGEWRQRLTPPQYHILREDGTEHAFSSPLKSR